MVEGTVGSFAFLLFCKENSITNVTTFLCLLSASSINRKWKIVRSCNDEAFHHTGSSSPFAIHNLPPSTDDSFLQIGQRSN